MGYDMYVINPDAAAIEQRDRARARFDEAVSARNAFPRGSVEAEIAQTSVDATYDAMSAADVAYFRLNIWGMSRMRVDMDKLGMLAPDVPYEWPECQEFGLSDWPDDDDARPEAREFLDATRKVLSLTSPDSPGIPVHKFGSNDGWIVTPLEIRSALGIFENADPDLVAKIRDEWRSSGDPTSYFDQWIAFLRDAGDHDGFEVH